MATNIYRIGIIMKTKEKYIQDLLIQADLYRLIALGFTVMDWENQSIFFDNLNDFLSLDFDKLLILENNFYRTEIQLFKELLNYKDQSLEGEYHRLFDLQSGIPFSEAAYVNIEKGNVLGDVTSFYKAVDFPYLTEKVGSPDTIDKETGFISYLFLKEFSITQDNTLTDTEKEEKKDIIIDLRYKFLNDHYLRWVPEFINLLMSSTENGFYLNLGKSLQLLIEKIH
ncbi:MAG: hypothetical protein KatS3mg129_3021 [Leptospiraceae bacterium]|nr:MAG: hypothetical protein KatS3mg129_3021 [Leptospiraceae bacterium]